VIRVDAEDSWAMTRTAAQRVPGTVTAVTVTPEHVAGPIIIGDSVTVTSPADVHRLLSLVNGLPVFASGVAYSCPAQLSSGLRLVFRDGVNGPVAATATANPTGCGTVSLTIDGRPAVVLGQASAFVPQVESVARSSGSVNPGGPVVTTP
jgi:hypothetical protein